MNPRLFTVVVACLLVCSSALAELPKAGQVYSGPKKFSSPQDGLAFTLPKGWSGGLDGEFFAIVDPIDRGQTGTALLWASKGTVADAKRVMSQAIPISGVMLQPKTPVKVRKTTLTATYNVIGGGRLTEATIVTRVSHGSIVAIVGASAPSSKSKIARLVKSLSSSLKISKPRAARSASASGSGSGEWYKWLVGARLTRFSSGSGYSEKESYTFCSDGTFYRSFGASSVSGNGSGAASANNSGRWSVSGKGNDGLIVLEFANGSVDRSAVVYRDGKTFWGGTRYFYEANQCR